MTSRKSYDAQGIQITYDVDRCLHAAECVRGLPAVFDPRRRPWIRPAAGSPDAVARVVRRCPTGALTFTRRDGGDQEAPPEDNVLTVEAGGPIFGSGDLTLLDAERRAFASETRVALCRCGGSRNKPYCDGTHASIGFDDAASPVTVGVRPPTDDTSPGLAIRLRAHGPLVLEGRYRLRLPDGREVEAASGALCRCGASSNKPFCDGTHRDIDFRPQDPEARAD